MKTRFVHILSVLLGIGAALLLYAFPAQATAVAKVGDTVLTQEDMEKEIAVPLYNAENNVFYVKKNWIDQKVKSILFDKAAKLAGLSRKDWETREIDSHVQPVTKDQIQQMVSRYPPAQASSPETVKQVTQYLNQQKHLQRENQVYQELSQKSPVTILIKAPEAPRVEVSYRPDDPVKGPKNARVTIVEFTDFQCPFCQRSQDTLRQLEAAYPQDVKLVARQNPLPFHQRAKPASEAALCAWEQGKFWEYRDKLFEKQQLADADFKRFAQELKLDQARFEKCLSEHRYAGRIEEDLKDGQRFGVNGTPHFFVNGRSIVGAQPFDAFKQAIDAELTKKKG